MGNKNVIWLMAGMICAVSLCFGCGRKGEEEKVAAKINNYLMTVEDLEDEIRHSPRFGDKKGDLQEALDLAIRKQVLIQEAQRQGLDKQKAFMKTIERYWRQTLIKELTKKESQRIYKNVSKNKREEAFKAWEDELYKKANIEIYGDVLREFEEKK